MGIEATVLIVDDEVDTAELLSDGLRRKGFDTAVVTSGRACLEYLRSRPTDIVITDVQMPGMSGLELCEQLRMRHPDSLSIVLTGHGNLETAITAIRVGAYDFLMKPVKIDALAIAVQRAVEHLALKREVKRLRADDTNISIPHIIGTSSALRETAELIRRVAATDTTVLVTGESGTGKELVARAIHELSPRRDAPFVAVNCAAMPAPLLESELFGHVRGAFTDAKRSRAGLFIQAGSGTILLDEVGEMPLEMQVKLLRALQERHVRPVGGDEEVPFEARLIASTNRDLETEVEERRFREDLFYRINVVAIPVPPLRARTGDIVLLANHFVERAATRNAKAVRGISRGACELLMNYDWPGNVRELENCMERAVAICTGDEIRVEDLPQKIQEHVSSRIVLSTDSPADLVTLEEMELRYVRQVLGAVGGNKTQAARLLGIDRRSLYRRLEEPRHVDSSHDKPTRHLPV